MARRRQNTKKPAVKKKRHWWLTTLKWLAILFVVGVVGGVGLFAYYAKDAPTITESKLKAGSSATVYDANDKVITTLGTENRRYVKSNQIPQQLKDAVVSIEDRRFYDEKFGIDPIRIVGAAVNNVLGRSDGLQGGSTLTQQLIKLAVFSTKSSDQTIKRKAQEAWLAMQLSQKYSKAQILEYYINIVYMDNNQYGMGTAADYYYGKTLKQLSLPQLALLAGMPQSPTAYDPYTHPVAAKTRRDLVLDAMVRAKKITSAQAKTAKATPITSGLVKQKSTQLATSTNDKIIDAYLTSVIAEVKKKMNVNPYTSGLKIYTNLDMSAQTKLYDLVNTSSDITYPSDKMQVAVTMTDPNTGKVIAQIGGRKLGNVSLAFNRATRNTRSNGSTMKPMMDYGPAIEYLNYSTYEQMEDTAYKYPGTDTSLYDWDKEYQGRISMRKALVGSRNIPAIRTLATVGVDKSLNFLKGLGITLPKDQRYLASGIGASVTTEQEAAAYGAFANGGTYYKPYYIRKVVSADDTVTKFSSAGSRAMKSSTAYMITDMLKGVLTSTDGTGTAAAISGLYEAGKTGTTNYSDAELAANPALNATGIAKDSWFTGYTRQRVISVWTGYDKATTAGLNYTQQTIAQQIYKLLMSYVVENENLPNTDWVKPSTVTVEHILSGSNPGTAVTGSTSGTTRELYVKGYGPSSSTSAATSSSSASRSSSSSRTSSSSASSASSSSASAVTSSSAAGNSAASSTESTDNASTNSTTSSSQTTGGAGDGGGGGENP